MGGAWIVCQFKGGLGKKEGGCVFEGGWYPDAQYILKGVLIDLCARENLFGCMLHTCSSSCVQFAKPSCPLYSPTTKLNWINQKNLCITNRHGSLSAKDVLDLVRKQKEEVAVKQQQRDLAKQKK